MEEVLFETQRIVATKCKEKIKVKTAIDILKLKQVQDIKDKVQEHFLVITLDTRNYIKSIELAGIGSLSCIPIDVSDVLRSAVVRGVNKLIVVHNHPSRR